MRTVLQFEALDKTIRDLDKELDRVEKLIKAALYSDEMSNGHGDSIGALNDWLDERTALKLENDKDENDNI